ncbi:MAG: hypothetical protein DRJ14_03365 [Acidobacteria bacterium]|nr:MAG: hypothetical protein DRJ14_03365 [Acidobacteriota bacterium]
MKSISKFDFNDAKDYSAGNCLCDISGTDFSPQPLERKKNLQHNNFNRNRISAIYSLQFLSVVRLKFSN